MTGNGQDTPEAKTKRLIYQVEKLSNYYKHLFGNGDKGPHWAEVFSKTVKFEIRP